MSENKPSGCECHHSGWRFTFLWRTWWISRKCSTEKEIKVMEAEVARSERMLASKGFWPRPGRVVPLNVRRRQDIRTN